MAFAVGVPPAEAATTRVVAIDPFAADGTVAPGYRVVKSVSEAATCDTRSYRALDTYQCGGDFGFYDPCWVTPAAAQDQALCLPSPYSKRAVRLRLADPPSEPALRGRLAPWGLTLSSGKRCTFIGGATAVIRGRRLNYGCTSKVFLLGEPRKSSRSLWRILGARQTKNGPVAGKTARVKVAYYGANRRKPSQGQVRAAKSCGSIYYSVTKVTFRVRAKNVGCTKARLVIRSYLGKAKRGDCTGNRCHTKARGYACSTNTAGDERRTGISTTCGRGQALVRTLRAG